MSDIYLLDTNIISDYFKQDRAVARRLSQVEYVVPAPVVGELHHWAFYPQLNVERLQRIRGFLVAVPIIKTDYITGERYGVLSATLEANGQRIPINDKWIAALALQHNLIVATRDHDFDRIPALRLEHW